MYSIFFILVSGIMLWIIRSVRGVFPTSIPLIDLVLIIFATFRLTRLFVYDKITFFIRDTFQHAEEEYTEEGVTYFRKVERTQGPLRTAYELLICPWCFSIWAALFVSFFYFFDRDEFWLPILIFAISGLASTIQIFASLIGWSAENRKLEAIERKVISTENV